METDVYQQQIEAGKTIVLAQLSRIAKQLGDAEIRKWELRIVDNDLEHQAVSLFDPNAKRIICKLGSNELADLPATPALATEVGARLSALIQKYRMERNDL